MNHPNRATSQRAYDPPDGRIQVSVYGVRLNVHPLPPRELEPATWREGIRRVNRHLLAAFVDVFALVADTLKAARSLIRGAGEVTPAIARRIDRPPAQDGSPAVPADAIAAHLAAVQAVADRGQPNTVGCAPILPGIARGDGAAELKGGVPDEGKGGDAPGRSVVVRPQGNTGLDFFI